MNMQQFPFCASSGDTFSHAWPRVDMFRFVLFLTRALCLSLVATSVHAASQCSKNLPALVTLRNEVSNPTSFCRFWLDTTATRRNSPFPRLSAKAVTKACACVRAHPGFVTASKGTARPTARPSGKCSRNDPAAIALRNGFTNPKAFCSFWMKRSRDGAPVARVPAAKISSICNCATKTPSILSSAIATTKSTTKTKTAKASKVTSNSARPKTSGSTSSTTTVAAMSTTAMQASQQTLEAISVAAKTSIAFAALTPPGLDPNALSNLEPAKSNSFSYGGAGSPDAAVAGTKLQTNATFKYPSVMLDHSTFVSDVTCDSGGMTIRFNDNAAFGVSKKDWPAQIPLLLITTSSSCPLNGTEYMFLAQSFDFGIMTAEASGTTTSWTEAIANASMSFGIAGSLPPEVFVSSDVSSYACDSLAAGVSLARPCRPNFDTELDALIGYIDDTDSVLAKIAPTKTHNIKTPAMRAGVPIFTLAMPTFSFPTIDTSWLTPPAIPTFPSNLNFYVFASGLGGPFNSIGVSVGAITQDLSKLPIIPITITVPKPNSFPIGPPSDYSSGILNVDARLNDMATSNLVSSPWGNQILLYSSTPLVQDTLLQSQLQNIKKDLVPGSNYSNINPGVQVFCLDCAASGQFAMSGEGFKVVGGSVSLVMNGPLSYNFTFGVNAFTRGSTYSVKIPTMSIDLQTWSLPYWYRLTPKLKIDIDLNMTIASPGQVVFGTTLSYGAFKNWWMEAHDPRGGTTYGVPRFIRSLADFNGWSNTNFRLKTYSDVSGSFSAKVKTTLSYDGFGTFGYPAPYFEDVQSLVNGRCSLGHTILRLVYVAYGYGWAYKCGSDTNTYRHTVFLFRHWPVVFLNHDDVYNYLPSPYYNDYYNDYHYYCHYHYHYYCHYHYHYSRDDYNYDYNHSPNDKSDDDHVIKQS
ncbi:hypothetical protein KVT40_002720 [Elsinoe batatas]|uniref:DUF7029 domain-containing protein n=1 Tax=Elsinoe batatas TaxID=2601811 RepID=A0A8K0L7E2_9PEZI|nr:hypothetical protein KVT40_002720 [Elsinoe batatas]